MSYIIFSLLSKFDGPQVSCLSNRTMATCIIQVNSGDLQKDNIQNGIEVYRDYMAW